MTAGIPQGQRFSHVYVPRAEPIQDSPRMRRRLASLIEAIRDLGNESDFNKRAEAKLGIATPWSTADSWKGLLAKRDLPDVLDLVTITYRFLDERRRRSSFDVAAVGRWLHGVNEIFLEENVHYTVDNRGGVHFKYDREFAVNTAATIAAPQSQRYANARDCYEKSLAALSSAPPDGKTSIRTNFAAVEVIFKLLLHHRHVRRRLKLSNYCPSCKGLWPVTLRLKAQQPRFLAHSKIGSMPHIFLATSKERRSRRSHRSHSRSAS